MLAVRLPMTVALTALMLAACGGGSESEAVGAPTGVTGHADAAMRAQIEAVARDAMTAHHMRALIIRITVDGQNVYTGAMGTSLQGVPATPEMRFRNGAFAFTYIGHIFAKLADAKVVKLDATIDQWLPDLPHASQIKLENLLNMTAGYADYVYQPAILDGVYADPYRQYTSDELIEIGVTGPQQFAPGTNWGYSHTNYVILGKVLEKITQRPLADVMQEHIIGPMKLTATSGNNDGPAVPEPALHTYSSERRAYLQVPPTTPFYEETTYWSPSWTTANGAVQTSNIYDVTTSMEIVGSGSQVSAEMYEKQVGLSLAGFGSPDPTGTCSACRQLTADFSYGMGVILLGPWITQTKKFAGAGVSSGYLPAKKLTISVAATYSASAFDANGDYVNASSAVMNSLANILAPGQAPKATPGR